jgi:hypothetical protein
MAAASIEGDREKKLNGSGMIRGFVRLRLAARGMLTDDIMSELDITPTQTLGNQIMHLVETVFDELKNLCQIQHTRHRLHANFIVNLMSGIVAYCLMPNKPQLSLMSSAPACR